jgi:hypothetical protein
MIEALLLCLERFEGIEGYGHPEDKRAIKKVKLAIGKAIK